MPSVPLELIVKRSDEVTIVTLRGDADLAAADTLANGLLPVAASRPAHVILDLSGLMFISSLAIGQFVSLRRSVAAYGGRVTIAAPQERVLKVLQHAQVESMFDIVAEMPRGASV